MWTTVETGSVVQDTSNSVVFRGNITAEKNLVIHDYAEGTVYIRNNNLRVAKTGKLKADIYAKSVNVEGEINGNILASAEVVIHSTGKIIGNIKAARLCVEDGGIIMGNVEIAM